MSWPAAIRAGIALAACALSAFEVAARRRGRLLPVCAVRGGFGLLATAAVCACLGAQQLPGFSYHSWELFHHYLGAKYQPELGYQRLYACTAVAESEQSPESLAEVRLRRLRDLETGRIVGAATALARPQSCKARFSPARWSAFRADVTFFRSQAADVLFWERIQEDHGYNAPPLGTAQGKLLASWVPATPAGLRALASLDPLLLAGLFSALGWAFGWRVLAVSLIVWGTMLPGNEFFTAGAMLRQDWLFWTILAACLARRRYPFLAGGALAAAALLRVFPVLLFAGWLAAAIGHRIRHRRFLRAHLRALAGALVVGGALVGVSVAATGPRAYGDFFAHLRVYRDMPLTNDMGLPQILAYRPGSRVARTVDYRQIDPFSTWIATQRETREARRPLLWALGCALTAVVLLVAARLRSLWIAQALGLVLLVATLSLPCYYYSVFLLAPLLGAVRGGYERAALLVAGASALLAAFPGLSRYWDDLYFAESLLFLSFSLGLPLAFGRRLGPRSYAPSPAG